MTLRLLPKPLRSTLFRTEMRSNLPRSIPQSLSFLFLSLRLLSASAQTCYGVGGSIAAGHTPCNPSNSTHSACCSEVDYCLGSGLCFDSGGDALVSRQSCTDQSWESQACPHYCMGCKCAYNLFPKELRTRLITYGEYLRLGQLHFIVTLL